MRPVRRSFPLLLLPLLLALGSPPALAQSFCDFAPRLTTLGVRAAVNVPAFVVVTVEDPNGDAIVSLTADTSLLPAGNNAAFTTNATNTSGTLAWTPQAGQTGAFSVSFTASNALSATATAGINVIDTGGAPFVQCPANVTTRALQTVSFEVEAADPDGEPIVSLTAAPLPSGATFSANATNTAGTFTWTPGFNQTGSASIAFTATSSTSASYTTVIFIVQVDRAPVLFAPPSASGAVGSLLTICVSDIDPDGDAIVSLTASPLPAGATFTSSTSHLAGTFSWTPAAGQAGSYTVTFIASNALSGLASVPITIVDTGDTPPVVAAPAAQTVAIGSNLSFNVTASDANGDPITSLTAQNLPPGASFLPNFDNSAGTFSWTPASGQGGTYFVVFLATANNLTSSATTAINVTGEELAATVFTTGGNGAIRLGSGKLRWCANVEPVGGDFDISEVVPTSIVMISPGTGSVSQISAIQGKGFAAGDADRDNVPDFEVCFSKDDLKLLFSGVTGRTSVTITIRGDLLDGSHFQGMLAVDVVGSGGPNAVSVTPSPAVATAAIRFMTTNPGAIRARVFDIRGRLVRTLTAADGENAGAHEIRFDGRSDSGSPLPSGIYVFRIETANGAMTAKTAILR